MSDFYWPALDHAKCCTRLIKLDASSSDGQLTGELTSVDMDNAPAYEALSYVWGTQRAKYSVELNGKALNITATLHTALQHLRRHDKPLLLWVDQICINQTDLDERNSQVGLMGRIYNQASNVIVWLGPEQHNDKVILGVLSKLASLSDLSSDQLLQFSKEIAEQIGDDARKVSMGIVPETKSHADMELHYLSDLFGGYHWIWNFVLSWLQNEWFDRTWCFQEAVLAQKCELLVGDIHLSWESLSRACNTIAKSGLRYVLEDRHLPVLVVQAQRENFQGRGHQSTNVIDLVGVVRERRATVPHDKIYGLLGLVQMSSNDAINIAIDYNKPFQQVYAELVTTAIRDHRSLAVLSYVQQQRDPSLPSWCPDWREMPCMRLLLGSQNPLKGMSYKATAGSVPVMNSSDNRPGTLQLRGCPIGRVVKQIDIESSVALAFTFRHRQFSVGERWQSMYWIGLYVNAIKANQVPLDAGNFEGRSDRYLKDLCRGHLLDPEEPTVKLTFALWRTLAADMLPGSGRSAIGDGDDDSPRSFAAYRAWNESADHSNATPEVFQEYEDWAAEWVAGRKVVLIESLKGRHHFALVPAHVEDGDEIVLLQGGAAPFVTQDIGESMSHRHLLGECYVDGMMDGEWMDVADQLDLWRDFAFV